MILRWGYVLASPVFHRWHHTSEAEGLDQNFAARPKARRCRYN